MGDLQVWVNGVENTISGLDTTTTSRDIAIALAQSYRLVGCFNLIEKSPTGERCLHPNEHPLDLSQNWGQNSHNCFILRKKVLSPTNSRPPSSTQSSPVRTRQVEVSSPVSLSSGITSDSSFKKKSQGPPIVKPKPKPKPSLETSEAEPVKPVPVPRKRVLVSSPLLVQEEVFQQSQSKQIYHQPDIIVKSQLPAYSNDSYQPKSQDQPDHKDHSTLQDKEGKSSAEGERLNQERMRALEVQRQQQEQVEKAMRVKRTREHKEMRQDLGNKNRREETGGQRPLKIVGQQEDEQLKSTDMKKHQEQQTVQDDNRRKEGTKDNDRKHNQEKQGTSLEKELEEKKQTELVKRRKKELDEKTKEAERVQSKNLAEQKEKLKQDQLQKERKNKKEMEKRKQQEDKAKEAKRQEEERKKAIEEEEEKGKLADLVKAQECKLNHQQSQLTGLDVAIQGLLKFENDPAIDKIQEEISKIEQSIQRNQALLNEKDFWDNELDLERQMHKKLEASVDILKDKVADCNRQISQKQAEIIQLTKIVKREEKMVKLDRDQSEEVKAVKEELKELKHEYSVITANLEKVNEKLNGLDQDFQEKQKELRLVEEDFGKEKTKGLHIIIPENNTEIDNGREKGSSPNLHRILKGSPRQLAVATPSSENPEGIFL
ncbi:uncharacterized protein [Apostichopus japonicus]|uniref:uncharacterized protein n=1 Tax=Stichopus japonicus TaxID=307972 RepID=UPI003AB7B06F